MPGTIALPLSLLAAALAAAAAILLRHTAQLREAPPETPHCRLFAAGDIIGGEDASAWRGGVFIVGSGDLGRTFGNYYGQEPSQGAVWAVDVRPEVPRYRKLVWENFPEGKIFHAHGIHYSNRTGRLFVVNHAGPTAPVASGTQVEVFDVEGTSYEDLFLRHVASVQTPELAPHGRLNDVVGVSRGEFYVTRWRHHPFSSTGDNSKATLSEKLGLFRDEGIVAMLTHLFARPLGLTHPLPIYRCRFSDDAPGDATCSVAGHHPIIGNGAAISPDLSTVVVSCPECKTLTFYSRDATTGDLRAYDEVELTYLVDNVAWEADPDGSDTRATLILGAIPRPLEVDPHVEFHRVGRKCAGAILTLGLERDSAAGRWKVTSTSTPVFHDGSKLAQFSFGNRFGSTYLAGSPFSPGLYVCRNVVTS